MTRTLANSPSPNAITAANRPQASSIPRSINGSLPAGAMFVRPRQACEMLGIGMTVLYALMKDGRIERRKIGSATVIPMTSIEAFAASLERAAA